METTEHVLRDCPMAAAVWFSSLGLRVQEFRRMSMRDWLIQLVQSSSSHTFDMCLVLIWTLWRTRNELVWNGTQLPPREVRLEFVQKVGY